MTSASDFQTLFKDDIDRILAKRHHNGADYWATADNRWGKGSPFSTFDCVLILTEFGVAPGHEALQGAARCLLDAWREDGRIRPAPKGAIYPCHTSNAARALGRLGYVQDERLQRTFEYLLETQHDGGGWRCNTVKLGKSPETDAANPGVTLYVLDALRFVPSLHGDKRLTPAVDHLLSQWDIRLPLGPCRFGIGSRFLQVEFPFYRYNLFSYVYVLSFYPAARRDARFRQALDALKEFVSDDQLVITSPHRQLTKFAFCQKDQPSAPATRRYNEILERVG